MRSRPAVTAVLGAAVLVSPWLATPASAEGYPTNNVVVVVNQQDAVLRSRARARVAEAAGDSVLNRNEAYARSSCVGCRTTAVAVQVVLVEGSPTVVTPTNVALAVNDSCTDCQTFAYAYQYVVNTDGPVSLDTEAQQQVADIRAEMRQLAASPTLSFPDLNRELDALSAELVQDVQAGLQRSGHPGHGQADREVDER